MSTTTREKSIHATINFVTSNILWRLHFYISSSYPLCWSGFLWCWPLWECNHGYRPSVNGGCYVPHEHGHDRLCPLLLSFLWHTWPSDHRADTTGSQHHLQSGLDSQPTMCWDHLEFLVVETREGNDLFFYTKKEWLIVSLKVMEWNIWTPKQTYLDRKRTLLFNDPNRLICIPSKIK